MRKFLYLFLVIVLAGCTEGLGVGLGSDIRGTYELESIDGSRLPYDISAGYGYREEIYAGSMRLESDGYFTESTEVEVNDAGRISRRTVRYTGEYEVTSRGTVYLYYDAGGSYEGEFTSRELRIYGDGGTIVYRRY